QADDPLERYRARRTAELLEFQARVITTDNLLATSTSDTLSFEEQRRLADRAEVDFTNVKKLLDDGRVSHLDALRLTNDFRRIGPNEMAVTATRLTFAENALSAVELELVNGSRDDRFELDGLLERLPEKLRPEAEKLFADLERRHVLLLTRRRASLEELAARAERAHEQVQRRLRILDEHYGFIRTHIFWVRDQEPVGAATALQAPRERTQPGRSPARLAEEFGDARAWGRVSAEFLAAALGLVVLPWPLRKGYALLTSLGEPRLPGASVPDS